MNKELDELIQLAKKFPEIDKAELRSFAHLECLCDKKLEALEIIKECLVSEFKLFEKDGEYFILFYFDETHELIFKLKNKEEYDLLKEVLL